ncbi:MAG: hypothetical protein WDW38_005777 [Sanguina aurantia]
MLASEARWRVGLGTRMAALSQPAMPLPKAGTDGGFQAHALGQAMCLGSCSAHASQMSPNIAFRAPRRAPADLHHQQGRSTFPMHAPDATAVS